MPDRRAQRGLKSFIRSAGRRVIVERCHLNQVGRMNDGTGQRRDVKRGLRQLRIAPVRGENFVDITP